MNALQVKKAPYLFEITVIMILTKVNYYPLCYFGQTMEELHRYFETIRNQFVIIVLFLLNSLKILENNF